MDEFRVTVNLWPNVFSPDEQTKLAAVLSRLAWPPTMDARSVSFVLPAEDGEDARYSLAASMHDRLPQDHHWLKYQPIVVEKIRPPYEEEAGTPRGDCIGSCKCRCSSCRSIAEADARDDSRDEYSRDRRDNGSDPSADQGDE